MTWAFVRNHPDTELVIMTLATLSTVVTASLLFCVNATAQSFNIDAGSNPSYSPAPPSTYGAAAGQLGVWNSLTTLAGQPGQQSLPPTALVDVHGNSTGVVISCTAPILLYEYDNPNTSGDHAALMDDWIEFDADPATSVTIAVNGLANGSYDVFTYSMVMDIGSPSSIGGQAVTGFPWSGDQVQGVSYARHQIDVTSGSFALTLVATNPFFEIAAWNGMQIVKLDGTFDSFCDGTSGNCPCANNGAPGHGCANSFDPNGALLSAQGSASVAGDTLVLDASGVSNSVVTFFQGQSAVQGGAGVPFGDGLRCAGGATIRLGAKLASGNQAHYPEGADAAVSVRGAIPAGGAERTYQVWYRNASAFCTPSTFNVTNAVRVAWAP